ncbi:Uncharacterized protein Adt_09609 [Abeliophyllum distichum]|uniref:Uncharacterized protein n=1 Tax=Abeliophyllum distichum TaxID=126358 RepID=A0ABD1UJ30_9LAMI
MPRVVVSSDNESSSDSTGESYSGSSSQSSDRSSSTELIDRRTSRSSIDFRKGESRPVSEVTRQSNDLSELGDRSIGVARAGGRMPPIRSSSANIQIGRSPFGHVVPLNISQRPVVGRFPFDTFWKNPQIRLFNSPVDLTPYLQNQIDQLINLDPPGSELNKVLTDRNMLTVGIGRPVGMDGVKYDLNAVLNSIPLATDDEGPAKDSAPSKRRKISDKGKGSVSGKELLTTTNVEKGSSRGRHLKDVSVDLPDDDPLDDETTFHDIRFPPTNANRDLELVRSCALEPLRTGLSRRKVSSVNKTLAVYTRRDSMALACEDLERHLEHMDLQEAELRNEVDNLKKEIGEKDSQAKLAESRAKAQEDEIDTLRSTLARAQEDAVSSYKASSEFSSCMHMYGAESMKASINLTKKWLAEEHPSIDPLGLEHFMARQRTVESATKKSVPKGRRDGTSRGGDAGGPSS